MEMMYPSLYCPVGRYSIGSIITFPTAIRIKITYKYGLGKKIGLDK